MKCYESELKYKIHAERIMLMLPLNVVMVAKIKGDIDIAQLKLTLNRLRERHALLSVRVAIEEDNTASFMTKDVPDFEIRVIPREKDDQWIEAAISECKKSFDVTVGPLVRFTLLNSSARSELLVCGHHSICDGKSMAYLIRDILQYLTEPDKRLDVLPVPPPITADTVGSQPSLNLIARWFLRIFNWKWAKEKIKFDANDLKRLHELYWGKNAGMKLLAWELSEADTESLISRCKKEEVTVNSALWTAFLAAQHEVQDDGKLFRPNSGLAVSNRDKLNVPVGEAFGFYASSFSTPLDYNFKVTFWDAARSIHNKIGASLEKTDIFRMLVAESIHPTLLDSLYFSKYGLLKSNISNKMLKQMKWDGLSNGYAITNVGKTDIPADYKTLILEALYGPIVYSDVNEKTVGVITLKNKLTFVMSYNESVVDNIKAEKIRKATLYNISNAL